MCTICKEKLAVVFITKLVDGKQVQEGVCLSCAKKLGIQPVNQLLEQSGITDEDLENINDEMAQFFEQNDMQELFPGGAAGFLMPMKLNKSEDENLPVKSNEEKFKNNFAKKTETQDKDKNKDKKMKYLDTYGVNLNTMAYEGRIDNVIGRDKEIERVIQILNRRTKNNPVLLGEPGVGKTAIAEGLAVRILQQKVPVKMFDTQVYQLDFTAMLAGSQFRGQFEARMKGVINDAKEAGNIVLVIDELHNIMGAGEAEGAMNAANILKPALARGEVQILGATTLNDYRKYIEKDTALERRFQPVTVDEPTQEEAIEIIKGIKAYYEDYHHVVISDECIESAVKLSDRYITDRFLPDKAIDVIDEASSKLNLSNKTLVFIENLNNEIYSNKQEQESIASKAQEDDSDYQRLAELKVRELQINDELRDASEKMNLTLTVNDIAEVIEQWTNIPVKTITEKEANRLLNLEERLKKRVVGQDEAVNSVARAIRRSRSGFKKKQKPASFIFVGPTGVGKTELVKSVAIELFGSEDALIRMDMSEYMEKHTVSRMVGAPPGYVGYDDGGQLTEKVRRKPYSVILLDEIEKAHPDVFNMLLQILDDGRLTDGHGKIVNFENTIIIMTSNAGNTNKAYGIGFSSDQQKDMEFRVRDSLKEIFRPEFLNRVDDIIVFNQLSKENLNHIADIMINEVLEESREKGMDFAITDAAKEFIISKGYDPKNGARPLRRTIQKYIEDELSEIYLKGSVKGSAFIKIDLDNDKLSFNY